jgi:glycosyltransferase involved in cell wall biosynthesis
MKPNALIIIGRLSYPGGTAPSNRVHLYSKALKEAGGFPFIINLHSTFNTPQTFNYLSRNDGIPFYYCQQTPLYEKNVFKRNVKKAVGLKNTIIITKRLKNHYNLKVLLYNTSSADEVFLFSVFKFLKIPIIKDCCEAPHFLIMDKKNVPVYNFFLRQKVKMYDHLLVISDYLFEYYSNIFPKNKIVKIPILVDMKRFDRNIDHETKATKVISYVGFMGGNKDGLENLIDAMYVVNKRIKNVALNLIGSAPEEDMLRLKNKVESLGLNNVITFLGSKNAEQIPAFLLNSDLLVLARPDTIQAKAGFSTKLGEYLASAKPVVITITGEISKYLKDKESAYLVEPDNIEKFADKIIFALSDINSGKIGLEGMKVAKQNFDYKLYGKDIIKLIEKRQQ